MELGINETLIGTEAPLMPLMKCGHTASGKDSQGSPVCVACIGIYPGARQIDENPPSLTGRSAKCVYCGKKVTSKLSLAYFQSRINQEEDRYYCGCKGWD